jgi:hypothetical protein
MLPERLMGPREACFPRSRGKLPEGLKGALSRGKIKSTPIRLPHLPRKRWKEQWRAASRAQHHNVGMTKLCSIASPPCGQRWVTVLVRV